MGDGVMEEDQWQEKVDDVEGELLGTREWQIPQSKQQRFIHGPITVEWMMRTIRLGKTALKTALLVRHLEGLNRKKRSMFPVSNALLKDFDLKSRQQKYTGLKRLETAGLIVVMRQEGASPLVGVVEKKRTRADNENKKDTETAA
jgi:hypothetical protein